MRERQRVVTRRAAVAAVAAAAGISVAGLAGCDKMDQALARQWMQVTFSPNTSAATALKVRAACSHIRNTPPLPLPGTHSGQDVVYGVQYDTTNSTPANLAELQTCLGKFKSVLGVNAQDAGDQGG